HARPRSGCRGRCAWSSRRPPPVRNGRRTVWGKVWDSRCRVWDFPAHSFPFCAYRRICRPGGNADFIGFSRVRRGPPDLRNGCALSAWRARDALVEGVGVLYLQFAPPDRPPMAPEGAHNSWRQPPAANRLAGDLLIKALIDESAKRPAKLRPDEIRHRA